MTAALVQRTKLLQEENDELYELLKSGETGKLKEEVRGLRKVVDRLERALKGGVLPRLRCLFFVDPRPFRISPGDHVTLVSPRCFFNVLVRFGSPRTAFI